MTSNYKRIGDYIRLVDVRNKDLAVDTLLGLSISKEFIPSVANTVGTNMANYKIINKGQFACSLMQVRRDKKIPVALQTDFDKAIISQAYPVFEVIDSESLDPEYLMMWMSRAEFDRHACFLAVGGVRGSLEWDDFCDMELPVPSIEKQREIVREYNVVNDRITLNKQLIKKLEDTAQAIYKQWFVDFEFPFSKEYAKSNGKPELEGKPYKASGGEIKDLVPVGWINSNLRSYAKVISGFAFKSAWWTDSGSPVIKIGSFHNNTVNYDTLDYVDPIRSEGKDKFSCRSGDIVIAMTGFTMGKIGLIPPLYDKYFLNQRVGKFDLGENPIENCAFLYCYLLSREFKEQMDSIGGDSRQANVSGDEIEAFEMLIPDEPVLREFNRLLLPVFNTMMEKINQNHQLELLKDILLQKVSKA